MEGHLHHTAGCLLCWPSSVLWLSRTGREKKKTKIPPKSAPSASSANPVTAKQLAGAAVALKPILLCCFARGKYMGTEKTHHLLHTCCSTSSKQFAVARQPP